MSHENFRLGLSDADSPDGGIMATGGRDRTVRIWEASSGRPIADLGGLSNTCRGLAFSSDGRMLGAIGRACLWDLTPERPMHLHGWLAGGKLARDIAFSPDAMHLVVSGYEQPARAWDISDPRQPRLERTLDGTHWTAAFSPDGQWLLAAGSSGHDVRRWELPGWTEHPGWPRWTDSRLRRSRRSFKGVAERSSMRRARI